MPIPYTGWGNKEEPAERPCDCLTMQQHWVKQTKKKWPDQCSVVGCLGRADVASYIAHPQINAPIIAPLCIKCTARPTPFDLRSTTALATAVKKETCG